MLAFLSSKCGRRIGIAALLLLVFGFMQIKINFLQKQNEKLYENNKNLTSEVLELTDTIKIERIKGTDKVTYTKSVAEMNIASLKKSNDSIKKELLVTLGQLRIAEDGLKIANQTKVEAKVNVSSRVDVIDTLGGTYEVDKFIDDYIKIIRLQSIDTVTLEQADSAMWDIQMNIKLQRFVYEEYPYHKGFIKRTWRKIFNLDKPITKETYVTDNKYVTITETTTVYIDNKVDTIKERRKKRRELRRSKKFK